MTPTRLVAQAVAALTIQRAYRLYRIKLALRDEFGHMLPDRLSDRVYKMACLCLKDEMQLGVYHPIGGDSELLAYCRVSADRKRLDVDYKQSPARSLPSENEHVVLASYGVAVSLYPVRVEEGRATRRVATGAESLNYTYERGLTIHSDLYERAKDDPADTVFLAKPPLRLDQNTLLQEGYAGDLHTYMSDKKVNTPKEFIGLIRDLCLTLGWMHERGFVHKNCQPSNVWIDDSSGVRRGRLGNFASASPIGFDPHFVTHHSPWDPSMLLESLATPYADLFSLSLYLTKQALGGSLAYHHFLEVRGRIICDSKMEITRDPEEYWPIGISVRYRDLKSAQMWLFDFFVGVCQESCLLLKRLSVSSRDKNLISQSDILVAMKGIQEAKQQEVRPLCTVASLLDFFDRLH